MTTMDRPQKITFADMSAAGVRVILVSTNAAQGDLASIQATEVPVT
jgi:hypothetical protein